MMATTLKITDEDFQDAVDIASVLMKSEGVVAYPTDTVYGIGGDATSEEAVRKVHAIKESDPEKPISIMVADFGVVEYYCDTGLWEDMILSRYLPGPYTFILKKKRPLPASKSEKIGVRMPYSRFCQGLCKRFGRPILTTSANPTGKEPPVRFEQVDTDILEQTDLAIDGGPTRYLSHSMVIDLVERKLIRKGGEKIDLVEFPER
ncbi:threonylcarbamoyl-AMP synthase [Candidatus Micrarchaeota archaeon]|nr:threonylcarbamoyl-AMP synthase [Candidatus Micrarchaeota archaeon]